jgi:hypothetical protein
MPDSVEGKGKSGPVYGDACAALTAILDESGARVAETGGLSLDPYRLWALDAALDNASDRESSEAIRRVLQTWADANWAELNGRARATALKRFVDAQYRFQRDFHAYIERWPRLRDDRELLSSGLCQSNGRSSALGAARADPSGD